MRISLRPSVAPRVLALALTLSPIVAVAAQRATLTPVLVTGVRLDDAFHLPGSNGIGLVVSVRVDALVPDMSSDDFVLALLSGRPGHNACLALRFLDGADPSRWLLLDDSSGSLARSYHALVEAKKAIVNRGRKMPFAKAGRYELVFFISTDLTEAALAYTPDAVHRPDAAKRHFIQTFKIPAR